MAVTVLHPGDGVVLDAPEDDAYDLVIAGATGAMEHRESAARLAAWTR